MESDLIVFDSFEIVNTSNCSLSEATNNAFETNPLYDNDFSFGTEIFTADDQSFVGLMNVGKESLGILPKSVLETGFNVSPTIENLSSKDHEDYKKTRNIFSVSPNTAFLQASPFSQISSNNSSSSAMNPSLFNSASLDTLQLSKIYSIDSSSIFNDAFLKTLSYQKNRLEQNEKISHWKKKLNHVKYRIHSVPECFHTDEVHEHLCDTSDHISERRCFSENIREPIELSDNFDDSVFIEANHVFSKMKDGSILNNDYEGNILDDTTPPELIANKSIDDVFKVVESLDSKSKVFKTIDKMLPKGVDKQSSAMSNDDNNSKIKETSEILTNLMHIIDSDCRNPQQKTEGHQLLNSLANILYSDPSDLELKENQDSGHSSFEQEDQQQEHIISYESYEVLDLSKKGSQSDDNPVLNLSMKSTNRNGRLSQSFSAIGSKCLNDAKETGKEIGFSSAVNLNQCSLPGKLKTKKVDEKKSRKGPLKALIPLGNMTKRSNLIGPKTPTKSTNEKPVLRGKRTSTPISQQILKPLFQSTPESSQTENKYSSETLQTQPRRKFDCPESPIIPSNRSTIGNSFNKSNTSESAPNLSTSVGFKKTTSTSSIPSLNRDHSENEFKRSSTSTSQLRRSYSCDKSKTDSVISKVKKNVVKTFQNMSPNANVRKMAKTLSGTQLSSQKNSSNIDYHQKGEIKFSMGKSLSGSKLPSNENILRGGGANRSFSLIGKLRRVSAPSGKENQIR